MGPVDDDDEDDFGFSDHDLDALPANALQQLETTAIRATQKYPHDAAEDALDRDDAVINLDEAPRFGQRQHGQRPHHHGPEACYGDVMEVEEPLPRHSQADAGSLLLRIKKLEQEKRRLNNDLDTARAEASKKAGEADNLRRRADAAGRTTEQRIAAQQRQYKDASDRLVAERDSLLRQLEYAKTSNAFDEHNARQAENVRRLPRGMPSRPKQAGGAEESAAAANPTVTPRKAQRTLAPGDGFDHEDVVMASPSKRRDKHKAGTTPRHPTKRKRRATSDSPIPALQLSEPRERAKAPELPVPAETKLDVAFLRKLWKDDHRFTLLHRLLAHRCSNGTDRVLEALTQCAFPSQPHRKLSSIVYDSLSGSVSSPTARELALRICRVFLQLWAQSLREKYYAPISLLLDALHFVLACEPAKTAVDITEEVVPLIVQSIRLVAVPVYEAVSNERKRTALFSPAQRATARDIDVLDCLDLLHLIATSCVSCPSSEPLCLFWRTMPIDLVVLLLTKMQPLAQMTLMLRILATSALPATLGPIVSDEPSEQAGSEDSLISRITNLFVENIAPMADSQESDPSVVPEGHIWKLRLRLVSILTQFSIVEHGATVLVRHSLCIGRLVKYLNSCITCLYTAPLSPTQTYKIASINAIMKLIHHLATSTGVNIKNKLGGTLGGSHAYHVSLTRLAFSEGVALEAGIEPRVTDMAHDMLDEEMSMEEGEALAQVFPSGNST